MFKIKRLENTLIGEGYCIFKKKTKEFIKLNKITLDLWFDYRIREVEYKKLNSITVIQLPPS